MNKFPPRFIVVNNECGGFQFLTDADHIPAEAFSIGWKQIEYLSLEEHQAIVEKLREALEFTLGCTRNLLCDPENKDLPNGLDPTFYQTLSYDGDMALREKYFKAKQILEATKDE